ncbi:unnamed protein product [Paramecium octaurelia]|uniref:Uncharacterized protein n=1 Tax=Paramecium octaurelia TaxID=43137 RepID=A0A8S1YBB0_PAROT|nr:unnamed protein product [Paramecium octaurelia]
MQVVNKKIGQIESLPEIKKSKNKNSFCLMLIYSRSYSQYYSPQIHFGQIQIKYFGFLIDYYTRFYERKDFVCNTVNQYNSLGHLCNCSFFVFMFLIQKQYFYQSVTLQNNFKIKIYFSLNREILVIMGFNCKL